MKKLFLIIAVLTLTAFNSSDPEKIYRIWHVTPSGNVITLHLNRQAALMHLEQHPDDWCHGRACPEPEIIPINKH